MAFIINDPISFTKDRYQKLGVAIEYIMNERGPLTSLGVEGLAFVNTKYAPPSGKWPDIQFHFAPSSVNSDGDQVSIVPRPRTEKLRLCLLKVRKITGLRDSVYNTVYKPLKKAETWTILPLLLRPRSTGWIRLKSNNPHVYPDINPNYFTHREDVLTLIEGIRIALNVSATQAFQRFGSRPHRLVPSTKKVLLFWQKWFTVYRRY